MQRFLKSDSVRKCTADINILITSRNVDRQIMHSFKITTGPQQDKGSGISSASSSNTNLIPVEKT